MGISAQTNWYAYLQGVQASGSTYGNIILNSAGGNVGIGTTNPQALLAVKGTIYCTRLKVTPLTNTTDWPDYVFANDYKLLSLDSVENYVKTNKHLPEIPSAQEVVNNGLDVADNQKAMLQKIEELTLYIIQQQKAIKSLNDKVTVLEKANKTNK